MSKVNVWTLPGPSEFLAAVAEDLRCGRSVLLGMSRDAPTGLIEEMKRTLSPDEAWSWSDWDVRDFESPLDLVWRGLGEPEEIKPESPEVLAAQRGAAGRLMVVRFVGKATWPAWTRFLERFERGARAVEYHQRPALVVLLEGEAADLSYAADVACARHDWRGVTSQLDVTIVATAHAAGVKEGREHQELRVALVRALACWDLELAEALAALPLEALLEPEEALAEFARTRGWSAEACNGSRWSSGRANRVYGKEVSHSADPGVPREVIRQRLWRGQVGVLLPLVEENRRDLIRRSRGYLKVPWTTDYGEVTDVEALEVGSIFFQLKRHPRASGTPQLAEARWLTTVRNELAHLRPVTARLLLEDNGRYLR